MADDLKVWGEEFLDPDDLNDNFSKLVTRAAISDFFAQSTDTTTGLTLGIKAGRTLTTVGVTAHAAQTLALPASQSNVYVQVNSAGVASQNTSGFTPSTHRPLFRCTTDGGSITAIDDKRVDFDFTAAGAALDSTVVHNTGDETIGGVKTFSVSPIVPDTPSGAHAAVNKTYADALVTSVFHYRGSTNCSTNPNYPAAVVGDAYKVSADGKIGGASGAVVEAGDMFVATADNAGGTQASVGSSWDILQGNEVNAAILAAALTQGSILFADSSGHVAQDNAHFYYDSTNKQWVVTSEEVPSSGIRIERYYTEGNRPANITLFRTDGTLASPTPLSDGYEIAQIRFNSIDSGSVECQAAWIGADMDGTPSSGIVPACIVCRVSGPDGANLEATKITSNRILRLVKQLQVPEISTPSSPPSGYGYFYIDSADSKPKVKNDGGTVYDLTSGGTNATEQAAYLNSIATDGSGNVLVNSDGTVAFTPL